MALNLDDLFAGTLASQHQSGLALVGVIDRNLTQMGAVVLESVVQAQASVSDDSGLISALQTASRVPIQGANEATVK
jgi:hypothetical protein